MTSQYQYIHQLVMWDPTLNTNQCTDLEGGGLRQNTTVFVSYLLG